MIDLNSTHQQPKFPKVQNVYFLATWVMLLLSILMYGLGYLFVKSVTAAPEILLYLATVLLYYHIPHFIFGIGSLIYYMRKVRKVIKNSKIYKTVIGILVSPISIIICYIGILLLGLSSCAG
jgi:cytochrome bd-type quinol oxidase subunit 2